MAQLVDITSLPFLTIEEAATLARISPKRLRALMTAKVLREHVHYTRPRGLRPRFKRDPLLAWLEGRERPDREDKSHRRRGPRPHCKLDLSLLTGVNARPDGV